MPAGIATPSLLGLGKETTWGTPAASSSVWVPILSAEPVDEADDPADESLYGTYGEREPFKGVERATIATSFDVRPQLLAHILRSLCGPPTSTQPDAVGNPTVWDHVFKWPRQTSFADLCRPNPYTLEVYRDIQTQSKQYKGCGVNTLSLALGSGDKILRGEAEWIAKGWPANMTKGTAAQPTVKPWLFIQSSIQIGSGAYTELEEWTLELNENLEGRHLQDGSTSIAELLPGGQQEASLSGTVYPRSTTEYDAYIARTLRDFDIVLTGDIITGTYKHTLTLDIPKTRYVSYPIPIPGAGRLSASWEAKPVYDTSLLYVIQFTVRTNVANTELA